MKRYILYLDVWDKRLDEIIEIITNKVNGTNWIGEITEKELRRLIISSNHYTRQGYSSFRITVISRLWSKETGKSWVNDLINEPVNLVG